MAKTILIAEDEQMLRESLAELLAGEGYEVLQAGDGKVAYELVLARPVDVVLTDIRMPEMEGLTLLRHLRQLAPETPVLLITAYGTVETAVAAMQMGAADYLLKPIQFEELLRKIQRALEDQDLRRVRNVMVEQQATDSIFHNLVGSSQPMMKLFEMVRKLSTVKSNVLIMGESGTGKELFARAIHYNGITREQPFVPVNCGAIPDNLVESELFGHRRGAFTGATQDRVGYFEAADGGTLFLDEISTLPLAAQSALLRVLETKVVVPLGDTRPRSVDVRIVAASNQDLEKMVGAGQFRADLLYRLDVVKLELPPLRQRKEDIPLLVQHFLGKYSRKMNKRVEEVSNAVMRTFLAYEWKGNVRELENVIERAMIFADGPTIGAQHLPFPSGEGGDEDGESLKDALREFERQHIIQSLRRHGYDKLETARYLGIGVSSLYRKLEEMNIPKSLQNAPEAASQPEP